MERLSPKELGTVIQLISSDGWEVVASILKEKIDLLSRSVIEPIGSVDSLISRAYYLGRIAGLQDAVNLPHQLKQLGTSYKEEEEN